MQDTEYTVGTTADVTGVSVRALHHYDEIGLLRPSRRSSAGYRLYSPDDVQRLQRIAFYRELGLDLADIADIFADPDATDEDHLRRQRRLIEDQIARFQAMLTVIDEELGARALGIALTPEQRREVFGDHTFVDRISSASGSGDPGSGDPGAAVHVVDAWEGGAQDGEVQQAAQRQQRTARYTKEDWLRLRAELHAIHQALADAMLSGTPPMDKAVMDLAERHRLHTDKWFHDCDHDTHLRLAGLYRDNRRQGRNYDDMVPGLSRYVHDAIVANCRRAKGSAADG